MENESVSRQIAFKVNLKDIITKPLVKQEGWLPNYVNYGEQKISRVNIIGTVISPMSEDEKYVVVDDGDASIIIRAFETSNIDLSKLKLGDCLNIIGKIREFNNEKYIMPEAIMPVTDARYVELRKKEITLLHKSGFYKVSPEMAPETEEKEDSMVIEEQIDEEKSEADVLLCKIKELDQGDGADIDVLVDSLGQNYEKVIQILIEQGDIFSTKPGKVKVLE